MSVSSAQANVQANTHDASAVPPRGAGLVFALLALALVALAAAVKIWGVVALTMAALPLVPVMFIIFIWISLP